MTRIALPAPQTDGGGQWPTLPSENVGLDSKELARTIDWVRTRNSTGFVIAHADGIVSESYWRCDKGFEGAPMLAPTFLDDGRSREDVASAQKSVVSVLVGIALGKGLLNLDDTVSEHVGPGWSRAEEAAEAAITLRHLLSMTSGLDHAARFQAAPGAVWEYNLGSTWHTLKRVLAAAAHMSLDQLLSEWLAEPLGMSESEFVARPVDESVPKEARGAVQYPNGDPIEGFVSSARDLARFGLAVIARGRVNDIDLGIPTDYLNESLSPSTTLNPSYGLLWWLNGREFSLAPGGGRTAGPLLPAAPTDTVAALGALGRAVYVMPSLSLVVVRTGGSPGETITTASLFGRELFEHLALPRTNQ